MEWDRQIREAAMRWLNGKAGIEEPENKRVVEEPENERVVEEPEPEEPGPEEVTFEDMEFINYRQLAEAVMSLKGGELKGEHLKNVQIAFASEQALHDLNKNNVTERSVIYKIFKNLLDSKNIKEGDVPNLFTNTKTTFGMRKENIIFSVKEEEDEEGDEEEEEDEEGDEEEGDGEEEEEGDGGPTPPAGPGGPTPPAGPGGPTPPAGPGGPTAPAGPGGPTATPPGGAPVGGAPDEEDEDEEEDLRGDAAHKSDLEGGLRSKTRRRRRATHFTKKKYKGLV